MLKDPPTLWERMQAATKQGIPAVLAEQRELLGLMHGREENFDLIRATFLLDEIEAERRSLP